MFQKLSKIKEKVKRAKIARQQSFGAVHTHTHVIL